MNSLEKSPATGAQRSAAADETRLLPPALLQKPPGETEWLWGLAQRRV